MNDKLILPDIAFNATGKCTLQYTDPITGKVMFETSGKNHVFIDQFVGTSGFQGTALCADLLLCQGGYSPGDDIPVIPGDPIGYGRVGMNGDGLFLGTYRAADSYFNKRTIAKVSNKYVYDFLQNQALGRVDWVGLTSGLGSGVSTVSWQPPHQMSYNPSYNKAYDCVTGDYYYTYTSGNYLYVVKGNTFTQTSERSISLYSNLSTFYSGYHKVCLDAVNHQVYVLVYYKQSSSGSYISRILKIAADFSGVEESTLSIASGGSYIQYGAAGGVYGHKAVWLYMQTYSRYRAYTLDLTTGAITSATVTAPGGKNYLQWDEYTCHVYKNLLWFSCYGGSGNGAGSAYGNNYFLYGSPLHNIETGELCSTIPPGAGTGSKQYRYRAGLSPYKAYSGQWVGFYYDTPDTNPPALLSAYTRYRIPQEVPDRPEGMGMTVTYELEIEW